MKVDLDVKKSRIVAPFTSKCFKQEYNISFQPEVSGTVPKRMYVPFVLLKKQYIAENVLSVNSPLTQTYVGSVCSQLV